MEALSRIELAVYNDTQTPGLHIEVLRYQPETDSFVIRELYATESGELEPLVSGHSLFRSVVEKRLATNRYIRTTQ